MARMKKKATSGAAKNYITRSQAVRKLQISLADFRRLCILKGIFPRQPRNIKKANKGSTAPTSFYYVKDIAFLAHEPILRTLREHKTFARKLSKAVGRREWEMAKGLHDAKPVYRLDHIIKQRYPTFDEALRDIDDALSLIVLFSTLPASPTAPADIIQSCSQLFAQWQLYVVHAKALRKVFLSIKGIYFQAEIRGQPITWLVPYSFTQHVPHDTDFRIMATFLELYRTLLGFVLYRLYTEANLVYPPPLDLSRDEEGAGVGAWKLAQVESTQKPVPEHKPNKDAKKVSAKDVRREIQAIGTGNEEEEELVQLPTTEDDETLDKFVPQPSKSGEEGEQLVSLADLDASASNSAHQTLFSPYYFYISRECPKDVLEFVLRSFGASSAQIGWDEIAGAGSALKEHDERITHHISDRPPSSVSHNHPGKRVYVQPQWIVDCANAARILSPTQYAPGHTLPPHLSPFVDDDEVKRRGGYVPTEAVDLSSTANADDASDDDDDDAEETSEALQISSDRPALASLLADPHNDDLIASAELEAEAQGGEEALNDLQESLKAAKKRSKEAVKSAPRNEDEEATQMAKMLMSNRQRKLYNKLSHNEGKRGEEKRRLEAKKQKLTKAK